MADWLPPKSILIADDTAFVRERFVSALEAAGHRAFAAQTAAELLERLRTGFRAFDLLVLDLQLSPAAGIELVREIRNIDRGQLAMLVFSGSILHGDEVRELAALGVCGYVNEYTAQEHIALTLAPHLYPDQLNRRISPRVSLGIPISYRFGSAVAAALTVNMSRHGIAVRTTKPLDKDMGTRVRFRLPGADKDIDADVIVKWRDGESGMGLRFENLPPELQKAIEEFVDTHFFFAAQDPENKED